jgi:uncharacterized membrane protein YkvA (DUF1232 family)
MDGFLKKVRIWLGKVQSLPLFGGLAEDLMTLIDLLEDYQAGFYRKAPKGILAAAAFGLGYALCPIDLILDLIPLAGYLDDAAILMLLLDFFIAQDLARYRSWKRGLQERGLAALRETCTQDLLARIGQQRLAAPFLTEKKQLRLLLCDAWETARPLRCTQLLVDIPAEKLAALGAESWEAIGSFYTQVFQDARIPWSALGPRPFMPEYDEQAKTDDFIVI